MDFDPCEGLDESVAKKRHGIWRNQFRNAVIADDARQYDDDTQVLITCETLEHAVHLKGQLPEFELVYREGGMDPDDRRRWIRKGLITPDEPEMTSERRQKLTTLFERNKLKKAIVTTVWNAGVDFRDLQVLIRADAGSSPINNVQIPGRVSRLSDEKQYGIIHDYWDVWNDGFRNKSHSRARSYEAENWTQIGDQPSIQPKTWEFVNE
jgi:superfamily II DNA or RNA helicase